MEENPCVGTDESTPFEYGYPNSNALLWFRLKLICDKLHKAACHPMTCDVIHDVKLFRQYITGYTIANF